jgi:hypothetical protein
MRNFRIMKRGERFYIERKFLCFWLKIKEYYHIPKMMGASFSYTKFFDSKQEARKHINYLIREVQEKLAPEPKPVVVEYISV